MHESDNTRRKRGSGKVSGAAATAKTATKNSGGNKKNFRYIFLAFLTDLFFFSD